MDRPAIVIRDIHHYGDDLTVPQAIARLCGGGQVTVTVTDPAPPGGDPRGNPRHGFDITVRPALGGQPELPPEVSWEARSFETPVLPDAQNERGGVTVDEHGASAIRAFRRAGCSWCRRGAHGGGARGGKCAAVLPAGGAALVRA
jgi:hypothetical protein